MCFFIPESTAIINKCNCFATATDQKAKKMKQSQEEEDLLRHVLSLRSRAPQQYSINLIKQNVKYFKNLVSDFLLHFAVVRQQLCGEYLFFYSQFFSSFQNKIDTASGEPFAPIYKHEPYEIELSDDLFQQQKSKVNDTFCINHRGQSLFFFVMSSSIINAITKFRLFRCRQTKFSEKL